MSHDAEPVQCDNPKYNIKDGSTLTAEPGNSTFVRLPPEEFHRLTTGRKNPSRKELKSMGVNFEHEEDVKESMCNGEPMQPMFLDYNQDEEQIMTHEGRMRAQAAKEIGKDNLPVMIFCRGNDNRRADCELRSGFDLRRNASPEVEKNMNL